MAPLGGGGGGGEGGEGGGGAAAVDVGDVDESERTEEEVSGRTSTEDGAAHEDWDEEDDEDDEEEEGSRRPDPAGTNEHVRADGPRSRRVVAAMSRNPAESVRARVQQVEREASLTHEVV